MLPPVAGGCVWHVSQQETLELTSTRLRAGLRGSKVCRGVLRSWHAFRTTLVLVKLVGSRQLGGTGAFAC